MSYDENRISDQIDGGLSKLKEEQDYFNNSLNRYLNDGIDYHTNTISKTDIEDLKQFASDSYHAGFNDAKNYFKSKS